MKEILHTEHKYIIFQQKILLKLQWKGPVLETNFFKVKLIGTIVSQEIRKSYQREN